MNSHNLEHEFFKKVKGWEYTYYEDEFPGWDPPDKHGRYANLPPISTSWDAFHEWVVPELQRRTLKLHNVHAVHLTRLYQDKIIKFMWGDKTPHRALEWAMEELRS